MAKCSDLNFKGNCFVEIIETVASLPEKETVKLTKLYPNKRPNSSCGKCIYSMISILKVFGVFDFKEGCNQTFKLRSPTAKYFLNSFAEYVKNNLELLEKWEEPKGKTPKTNEVNMFFGPHFLHVMEKKRVEKCENAVPLRFGEVARVIIKSTLPKSKKDVYLLQYDSKVHHYKLIGGNRETFDTSMEAAVKREITEELPLSKLELNRNYRLREVFKTTERIVSFTHGAYSEYKLCYFHCLNMDPNDLKIGQVDKWLTIEEIKKRKTKDGVDIFPLSNELIEIMENLPLSINQEIISQPSRILVDPKWWTGIVAIATVLASIFTIMGYFRK